MQEQSLGQQNNVIVDMQAGHGTSCVTQNGDRACLLGSGTRGIQDGMVGNTMEAIQPFYADQTDNLGIGDIYKTIPHMLSLTFLGIRVSSGSVSHPPTLSPCWGRASVEEEG